MIEERPVAALRAYASLFPGPQAELAAASILAGNTDARLWIQSDDATDVTGLLWDRGNNVVYLGGDVASARVVAGLAALVAGPLRDHARAEGRPYIGVRALTPNGAAQLPRVFAGVELREARKQLYAYLGADPPRAADPQLERLSFAPIDAELLGRAEIAGVDEIAEEVAQMWRDPALFAERGLGVAALLDRQVACWCTAEYVSRDRCGIGIATRPELRRRGVASATAARFVAAALARGLRPYWECSAENLASARVAQKLGFTLVEEPAVWVGQL